MCTDSIVGQRYIQGFRVRMSSGLPSTPPKKRWKHRSISGTAHMSTGVPASKPRAGGIGIKDSSGSLVHVLYMEQSRGSASPHTHTIPSLTVVQNAFPQESVLIPPRPPFCGILVHVPSDPSNSQPCCAHLQGPRPRLFSDYSLVSLAPDGSRWFLSYMTDLGRYQGNDMPCKVRDVHARFRSI